MSLEMIISWLIVLLKIYLSKYKNKPKCLRDKKFLKIIKTISALTLPFIAPEVLYLFLHVIR